MARLARRDHGLGRAAGPLGVGAGRVEPEAEGDADRLRAGPEHGDRAVDAAAHRDRDTVGVGRGAKDLRQRVRERVGRERLPGHGGRFEQRQPVERAGDSGRVGLDDPVVLDDEPDEGKLAAASRVPEDLDHEARLADGTALTQLGKVP